MVNRVSEMKSVCQTRGFTLLELILVLLIIGLRAGASMVDFGEFHRQQQLKEAAGALKRLARMASRSSAAWNVDYRLRFEPARFFLVQTGKAAKDSELTLASGLRMELRSRGDAQWRVPEHFDWVFPGTGVSEPLQVRLSGHNGAFVEMMFNPLTGAVDQEKAYYP